MQLVARGGHLNELQCGFLNGAILWREKPQKLRRPSSLRGPQTDWSSASGCQFTCAYCLFELFGAKNPPTARANVRSRVSQNLPAGIVGSFLLLQLF